MDRHKGEHVLIILWIVPVDLSHCCKMALKMGKRMKQGCLVVGDSQLSVGSEAIWMRRKHS